MTRKINRGTYITSLYVSEVINWSTCYLPG